MPSEEAKLKAPQLPADNTADEQPEEVNAKGRAKWSMGTLWPRSADQIKADQGQ